MIIGITGTRKGLTEKQFEAFMSFISKFIQERKEPKFEHGGCIGVDKEIHDVVTEIGFKTYRRPCNLEHMQADCHEAIDLCKPKGPLERNIEIVNHCDILLAFPDSLKEYRRSGTWNTIRSARISKKKHVIIYPDGKVEYVKYEQ